MQYAVAMRQFNDLLVYRLLDPDRFVRVIGGDTPEEWLEGVDSRNAGQD